jgi:hypothetical protein
VPARTVTTADPKLLDPVILRTLDVPAEDRLQPIDERLDQAFEAELADGRALVVKGQLQSKMFLSSEGLTAR